ncbi:hypothetical protein KCU74_g15801, partial [Aureobasidium melanogenum]
MSSSEYTSANQQVRELLCGVAAEEWLTACKTARFIAERAKDDGIDWTSSHGFFAQMEGFRLRFRNLDSQEPQEPQRTSIVAKKPSLEKHSIAAPSQEPLLGRLSFPHANCWDYVSETAPRIESQPDLLSKPVDVAIREKSFKSIPWDLAVMSRQHDAFDRSSISTTRSFTTQGPSNSAHVHAHASDNKHELASPPPPPATRHHIQSLPVLSKVEPEEETQDPPPFASHNFPSLYFPPEPQLDVQPAPPPPDFEEGPSSSASSPFSSVVQDTKAALPQDTKPRSDKAPDDSEPPPPYTEGTSPLDGFTYLMAQAGGA